MMASDCLFALVYLIALVCHCTNYCAETQDKVFQSQTTRFIIFYSNLVLWYIIQQATVHMIDQMRPGSVSCSQDGQMWTYCDCSLIPAF